MECGSRDGCSVVLGWFRDLGRITTITRVIWRERLDTLVLPRWWPRSPPESRGAALRSTLESLGPVFVKLGQTLSTRPDLLPVDIATELAKLQDQVPPFDSAMAMAEIERELKAPISDCYASFDAEPLAAASIAQVHTATLLDGREVVVKVLRPKIENTIARDVSLMYLMARLVHRFVAIGHRLRPVEVVAEFEKTLFDELDLQREAANAATFRRHFKDSGLLYTPEVHWPLTRRRVLTIERIVGIPVSDIQALRDAKVNLEVLAQRGVEIFFTQVFRDNFFHADMHPGNIFVDPSQPDTPSYVSVDFGIVGSLTHEDREYLAHNLLAFFHRDYRRVAEMHVAIGWVPAHTRVEDFESAIRTVAEPIFEKPLDQISFGMVLLRLFQIARRYEMQIQPQLVLLQKTLLNIEGLGRELYPQLDLWTTAKPYLERWMSEQSGPRALRKKLLQEGPQYANLLPALPRLVHEHLASSERRHQELTEQLRALRGQRPRPWRRFAWILAAGSVGGLWLSVPQSLQMAFVQDWQSLFVVGLLVSIVILLTERQ